MARTSEIPEYSTRGTKKIRAQNVNRNLRNSSYSFTCRYLAPTRSFSY